MVPCTPVFDPSRKRWPRDWLSQLEILVYQILAEDHPASVRHVFYRLTDHRLPVYVPKTQSGYERAQRSVLAMRREGRLPWEWIVDSTRMGYHVNAYGSADEYLEAVAGFYRQDLWSDEDLPTVEVWCESRSIASVLRGECRRLAVSLYPCGGFASASLAWEAAQTANARQRPLVVVYVGDHDPSGVLIDRSLEKALQDHLTVPLTFERLAVTEAQIVEMGLPSKPRKPTERRSPHVLDSVEAEAIPAPVLRRLVVDRVESYLPADRMETIEAVEASEREILLEMSVSSYLFRNGV